MTTTTTTTTTTTRVGKRCILILLSCLMSHVCSFTSTSLTTTTARSTLSVLASSSTTKLFASSNDNDDAIEHNNNGRRKFVVAAAAAAAMSMAGNPSVSLADTIGKETEAPTLSTGEAVMICKKRGPLGACTETVLRTPDNDNDKATKYFVDPKTYVKSREDALKAQEEESEGSELIRRLRQQTEENRERNELIVRQKTLENDQSASFGPFDRQVVILNEDGKTYTLLQNPQAMRLKKAGYIVDRRFVKQPSKEVIEEALNPSEEESGGIGGFLGGLFGGGGGGGSE